MTSINPFSTSKFSQSISIANQGLTRSITRISSGKKNNSAADDAVALANAIKLTSKISGLVQAERNANDGISLAQVAEGALNEVNNILQRSRELSIQASNGINSALDRKAIQSEINQLQQQANDIIQNTSFNGVDLFKQDTSFNFQVGNKANQTISIEIKDPLEQLSNIDVTSQANAQSSIEAIDQALQNVSDTFANLGASQARLASAVENSSNTKFELQKTRSRINDTDLAKETSNIVKNQLLLQSSLASISLGISNKISSLTLLDNDK